MKIDPNDSAFPITESTNAHGNMTAINDSCAYIVSSGGLTIRAHFAALAMQGMLSYNDSPIGRGSLFARNAVEYADALITELNK